VAKLEASPNDSEVCLEAGKYFSFKANDWDRGLPLLAKGSDTELSRLAVAELNGARTPDAVTTGGDSWWDWAQKEKGIAKTAASLHAVELYASIIKASHTPAAAKRGPWASWHTPGMQTVAFRRSFTQCRKAQSD